MELGTLASIWRYPVKSLRGERLARAEVDHGGIPGDRSSALFVSRGHAREGKPYRGKEHDRLHLTADPEAARRLGAEPGVDLEYRAGKHFFDAAPISILIDRWMAPLNAHVGYSVEPERFRPNFFVRATAEFDSEEAALSGATLYIGQAKLRVRQPIERCVAITYDPRGGANDPEILRFLAQRCNGWMGIYCDVVIAGTVQTGEPLVLSAA
ncbi:MAG TPA: MOSC N-terminal beta barrel domain-containing protein [Candidatus Tumulicola sp.]|jgi:hypothetical protein